MEQNALTVIVPVRPGPDGRAPRALRELLDEIGRDVEGNRHLRFRGSPSTHFARFVLLEHDRKRGPRLLFSSNHDGDLDAYARELAAAVGPGLEAVFGACVRPAGSDARDPASLLGFLRAHSLKSAAFFVACRGASAAEIHAAAALRESLDAELDGPDRAAVLARLTPLVPPAPPAPRPADPGRLKRAAGKLLGRVAERLAGVRVSAPSRHKRTRVEWDVVRREDLAIQNQMTVVSKVSTGWWPSAFVKLAFRLVSRQAERSQGSLSGLTTIHFARWVVIDGGDHLLFESNYDGSWENYIDDFVDFASTGMNVVWGTAVDFPPAGCKDIEAFKQIIRHYQVPTQVFYSAYPRATVRNNLNDLGLARAVATGVPDESVRRFVTGSYTTG